MCEMVMLACGVDRACMPLVLNPWAIPYIAGLALFSKAFHAQQLTLAACCCPEGTGPLCMYACHKEALI